MVQEFRGLLIVFLFVTVTRAEGACHQLSVFIRTSNGPNCYLGHAGIGLNNEYYDWGPTDDTKSDFVYYLFGDKGEPYEDKRKSSNLNRKGLATSKDIRNFLKTTNQCEAYEVRAWINDEQAALLQYYWNWIYEEAPYFHVFKNQCANIAFRSLRYSNILSSGNKMLLPSSLLKRVQSEVYSSCGKQRGKLAQTLLLKAPPR